MKKGKIKNPLIRRIPRELTGDWRKYLVVSLFLILTIGFVSGMYVANGSMMAAADAGVEKYRLDDGHFELDQKADPELIAAIESGVKADLERYYLEGIITAQVDSDFQAVPVRLYENFFRNADEDNDNDGITDGTVRVYPKTEEINLACLMEGRFPDTAEEIAIDRMHADNAGIKTGDVITVGGQSFTVSGLLAYVNYSTLHEKSTDLIFDALKFNVGMVTEEGFDRLGGTVHYSYAWKYETSPAAIIEEGHSMEKELSMEEKNLSDNFLEALFSQAAVHNTELKDYMPRYANPAINFASDDMGSDKAMGGVLLNILIVIIAFIFAVTISNTIARESQTIGTLRASGYTRGELVRHYLAMPVIVTFVSAALGNLAGYTLFKYVVVSMYYNSYSLPAYETIWNPEAFVKTTFIPVALMLIVNLAVILKMMRHTPLQFLRRDLKKTKREKAIRLPRWSFFGRFRLRVMLQNASNYLILFFGIFFISVLLAMAVGMPDTLDYYKENAVDMMFARYQYVLNTSKVKSGQPVQTADNSAEPFGLRSLLRRGDELNEEISVYGVSDDSRYVELPELTSLSGGQAYVSTAFRDKYDLAVGDTVLLDEKYENRQYEFQVAGFYDKCVSLAVFLPMEQFRDVFDLGEEEFSGYLSDTEITDIEEEAIATVITERDITKMCDQLDHSMGAYMQYFQVLCSLLSAVLIYLLAKIIIEKNENAISMVKILGYENREIASLYLLSTTIVVVIADAVSTVLGIAVMEEVWKAILAGYSGWFPFVIRPVGYGKIFALILAGYLIVVGFDFKRIRRVPMDEALKNVE